MYNRPSGNGTGWKWKCCWPNNWHHPTEWHKTPRVSGLADSQSLPSQCQALQATQVPQAAYSWVMLTASTSFSSYLLRALACDLQNGNSKGGAKHQTQSLLLDEHEHNWRTHCPYQCQWHSCNPKAILICRHVRMTCLMALPG